MGTTATLTSYIEKYALPWEPKKAIKMLACITAALSKTSSQAIVHRDLHPGNIILRPNFDPDIQYHWVDVDITIMDYGCHKNVYREWFKDYSGIDQNKIDEYIGKRDYLRLFGAVSTWSPEFLNDPYSVDIPHDIWALGVLLFKFLTGDFPIRAKSFSDLYANLVTTFEINWDLIDQNQIHWAIKRFLQKLLSPNPKGRYLHDDIVKICIGLASDMLYQQSDQFIREFLVRNGDLCICPLCKSLVFPHGGILCTACGQMIEDSTEWGNPFV